MGHKSSAGTESSVLPAHSLVAVPTAASSQLEVRCNNLGGIFFSNSFTKLYIRVRNGRRCIT